MFILLLNATFELNFGATVAKIGGNRVLFR